ncbi:NADP-dependent oxidoreductase domain-containing protein [Chiua virens]|nr:NADP-dependent oxidoreductase domain-containing protein [Chiua virens]
MAGNASANMRRILRTGTTMRKGAGARFTSSSVTTDLQRSDVFYTSKLKSNSGKTKATKAIDKSLRACGLGYIDLYLIHSPLGGQQMRRESWEAVVDAQKEGKLKSIGISNFGVRHMEELLGNGLPDPAVNQVDLHPFMTRTDIVAYCTRRGILLEAWAPLVEGMRFNHSSLTALANAYNKEPAQILLRYSLQKVGERVRCSGLSNLRACSRGSSPCPNHRARGRIVSNTQLYDFELRKEEIEHLDSLNEG